MLCGNTSHRLLRKCRSERKLRELHERKNSMSSTTSADTLHHIHQDGQHDHEKSSISSSWDPLRLHPTGLAADRSPLPACPRPVPTLVRTAADHDVAVDHWGRPIVSRPPTRRPPPHVSTATGLTFNTMASSVGGRRAATPSVEINDDFDFGFTTKLAPPPHHAIKQRRPSTSASSTCSSDSHFSYVSSTTAAATAGVFLSVDDDHRPTVPLAGGRRPRPALASSPDYLLKHGAWKRRGIVFVSEEAHVTEDDCFDIP